MPTSHQSEAIVLRTWPFGEADLMVAIFTREQGVVRGVARHAMRSRRRFGGALEPMTHVRAEWTERPRQDAVRLDRFEILWSPMTEPVDYARAAALAFVAEVLESALPDHAVEDDIFRLALASVQRMRGGGSPLAVVYFALWITRLLGWMPELRVCVLSGASLRDSDAYYSPLRDGLIHPRSNPPGSLLLSVEALRLAETVLRKPLGELLQEDISARAVAELRRFSVSTLERHLEERLRSARAMARMPVTQTVAQPSAS